MSNKHERAFQRERDACPSRKTEILLKECISFHFRVALVLDTLHQCMPAFLILK
jgi:hypothetical protein